MMWSDLPPLVLVLLAMVGAGCVVVCVVIDRLVVHSRFPDHYDAVYVTVVVVMSLAALAVTVRVLRPDRHRGQVLAVSSILAVVGLVAGVLGIGGWAGVSAYQRNRHVPAGPDLAQLAPIEGITGTYVRSATPTRRARACGRSISSRRRTRASGGTGCHRSSPPSEAAALRGRRRRRNDSSPAPAP